MSKTKHLGFWLGSPPASSSGTEIKPISQVVFAEVISQGPTLPGGNLNYGFSPQPAILVLTSFWATWKGMALRMCWRVMPLQRVR